MAVQTLRLSPISCLCSQNHKFVTFFHRKKIACCFSSSLPFESPHNLRKSSVEQNGGSAITAPDTSSPPSVVGDSPLSGVAGSLDVMTGYVLGMKKATEVAHSVWKNIVQKGNVVVDATCGNGHDTLELLRMVADKSCRGRVYAMDIQKFALESTSSLLDEVLDPDEKELVELHNLCHSKMEQVISKGIGVRLVTFNLGYLPGGDKTIITRSETTVLALEAARRILAPGGLISLVVYVGHPGGREEYERVEAFASGLPVADWICCKLQMLNRPLAPIIVFLFRR